MLDYSYKKNMNRNSFLGHLEILLYVHKPQTHWVSGFAWSREYSINRVVTTSRLKAPRHLVVLTKYSERSVQNLGFNQLSVLCALGHCTI